VVTYISKRIDYTGIALSAARKVLMAQQLHGGIF
jgi:hypothetical protein